jgi:hypothetical protein
LSLAGSRLTEQPLPDGGTPRQALLAQLDLIDANRPFARMSEVWAPSTAPTRV